MRRPACRAVADKSVRAGWGRRAEGQGWTVRLKCEADRGTAGRLAGFAECPAGG